MSDITNQKVLDVIEQVKEGQISREKAIDQKLAGLVGQEDFAQVKSAVEQLEAERKTDAENLKKQLDQVKREMRRSGDPSYHGAFASEDQARAFGAFVFAKVGGSKKAAELLKADYPDIYARAMDSTTDGALIAPEFSGRLVRLREQYGVFERNAYIMPMSSDSLTFMKETGDVTVYNLSENTAGTATDPTYTNITLNTQEWGVLSYVPKTLDEDAMPAVGELIARSVAYAMAKQMDNCGFNGDGTSTYFNNVGLRKQLVTVNGVDTGGGLLLADGNAYSEITLPNLGGVPGLLPEHASGTAKWYVSRAFYWNVMIKLALAAGGNTITDIQNGNAPIFMGYPVEISQVMPTAEANSQVCALLGDISMAATVGRRRGMSIEQSTDYKFAERQISILATQRVALNVHDVGSATEGGPVVGLITAAS